MSGALKLTAYFGERSRVATAAEPLLADELLRLAGRHRIAASVLLRGIQGFGARHSQRTDRLLTLSEDLPLAAIAVDEAERIRALAAELRALGAFARRGLLTLERVEPVHPDRIEGRAQDPPSAAAADEVLLTVYLGRHERSGGTPSFLAACELLREHGVAGATVLLGVDGTLHGERHRARFFGGNAGVPLALVSVGPAEPIAAALRSLNALLAQPLFTLERVRVCKRDGHTLRGPHTPADAAHGMRQKLTVVVSEAAHHERRSIYLELVRRLRAGGAAGATSLRGIWGFHGDHAPHGDRLFSLRRHVPVLTLAIDSPERIAALYPIVDELTGERGLVTSELLPPKDPAAAGRHRPHTPAL